MSPEHRQKIRTVVLLLNAVAIAILGYLLFLPVYPLVGYQLSQGQDLLVEKSPRLGEAIKLAERRLYPQPQPKPVNTTLPDRIIIPKIGVNAPIVESNNDQYALDRGAWILPDTSTPDQGGNTVISGHRFKYLPPNNLTFYLLDKLRAGDKIEIKWRGKSYEYIVDSSKVVPAEDTSILAPNDQPRLTLFTCDPIFSTKNRLAVVAKLVEK